MVGGTHKVEYKAEQVKKQHLDEYTREVLPTHLVKAAIVDERDYFNEHVWESVPETNARGAPDFKIVRTRWVISNKGDTTDYDVRARLVACELNQFKTDEFYASTPPARG